MPENKFTKYFYTGGDWRESFATEKPDVFYITEYGKMLQPSQKPITESDAKKITGTTTPPVMLTKDRTEDLKKLQEHLNEYVLLKSGREDSRHPRDTFSKKDLTVEDVIKATKNAAYDLKFLDPTAWMKNKDTSDFVKITAPNTDTSKFIFGNKISKDAIAEIKRVAKLRNQDPYDILAHMLIEGSGEDPITKFDYANVHDINTIQLNPRFVNFVSQLPSDQLKNMGVYREDGIYNPMTILKAASKYMKDLSSAYNNVYVPTSNPDATSFRMQYGRDFNPAQKGYVDPFGAGEVKNTYLDMIDSAIGSLKQNMPNLFSNENN